MMSGMTPFVNESVISVGHHVKAIDEFGNWSEAEIINIIENYLILRFLSRIEEFHLIIDILNNRFHHIVNPQPNKFLFRRNMFEIGDFVLAKRNNGYDLSQIMSINSKDGTKEYNILYLFENVYEIVSKSNLKCPKSSHNIHCDIDNESSIIKETLNLKRNSEKSYDNNLNSLDLNLYCNKNQDMVSEKNYSKKLKVTTWNSDSNDSISSLNFLTSTEKNEVYTEKLIKTDVMKTQLKYSLNTNDSKIKSKNLDYFFMDSTDNTFNDINTTSTNNSEVSTPLPFEASDEFSNHSPTSSQLTTDYSSYLKQKTEYFLRIFNEKVYSCEQILEEDCFIDHEQIVSDHEPIVPYTSNDCNSLSKIQSKEEFQEIVPQSTCSPINVYYSTNVISNRTHTERKKRFTKSKMKSLQNDKSQKLYISMKDPEKGRLKDCSTESTCSRRKIIIDCHRCRKSVYKKNMIQCQVCLCWSHSSCYQSHESRGCDRFWECEGCAGPDPGDGSQTVNLVRDKTRFHSVLHDQLPWSEDSCGMRNIGEMQSILSLSKRVLIAISQQMDLLIFKNSNDITSQDDLDILKNLYDNLDNIEISIPKTTIQDSVASISSSQSPLHDSSFFNSTPIKSDESLIRNNNNYDGILDCEIQKLDIIPKADFDALMNDINFNDNDICKEVDSESRGSVGFIGGNCKVVNSERNIFDSMLAFSDSSFPYQNLEIEQLCYKDSQKNDYVDNNIYDKSFQGSIFIGDNISSEISLPSKLLFSENIPDNDTQCLNTEYNAPSIHKEPIKCNWSSSDIGNNERDLSSSMFIDNDNQSLSIDDSNRLEWLRSRYEYVRRLVEVIEAAVMTEDDSGDVVDECGRYRDYFHWLLYTVERQ